MLNTFFNSCSVETSYRKASSYFDALKHCAYKYVCDKIQMMLLIKEIQYVLFDRILNIFFSLK